VGELLRASPSYPIANLTWWPIGIGYYPVNAGIFPYDQAYFDRFARQAKTAIGYALMDARVDFVARHYNGFLCDVGIGSGAFIERRGRNTFGWDVNPAGFVWLMERDLVIDPTVVECPAVSMWDVLEHIPNFLPLLDNVQQWLFLSLPIFRDANHALGSKHFRRDEHYWYFCFDGLCYIMDRLGFDLVEYNDIETKLGREDIGSFAFKRRNDGKIGRSER
jgi:hypothetical protein